MSTVALTDEIATHLLSKGFAPTAAWLNSFLAPQRPGIPLVALKQTALFRLANTDITSTLQRSENTIFPTNIHDANIKDRKLVGPIPAQVLDIEDIGHSRWSQFEAMEADERGETTRGREIIRVIPGEEDESLDSIESSGPHKLLLQDAKGTKVYAIELAPVDGIGVNMSIGAKLVLRDLTVARGVLMLEPQCVTLHNGKIEELHQKWKEGRKEALKLAARASSQPQD